MRLLVLGGTEFVGRALVETALDRGHDVTVLNRGHHPPPDGVTTLTGDRTTPGGLDALHGLTFDAVADTWSRQPHAVADAARTLAGHAGHYTYVSTRSVYADPQPGDPPLTENSPLVEESDDLSNYAGIKRAAETATDAFDGPVLLARAGLILGPYENIGRLPWWLTRLARGGPTLAPGPHDLPLQHLDARDLAAFILDAATAGHTGPYNLTSDSGTTTMGELLDTANRITGNHADLHWTDPHTILDAGIQPWTQLPIWLPPGPDHDYIHRGDTSRARNAGLRIRPITDTITDTWTWLQSIGGTAPQRPDRPVVGLDPDTEHRVLTGR